MKVSILLTLLPALYLSVPVVPEDGNGNAELAEDGNRNPELDAPAETGAAVALPNLDNALPSAQEIDRVFMNQLTGQDERTPAQQQEWMFNNLLTEKRQKRLATPPNWESATANLDILPVEPVNVRIVFETFLLDPPASGIQVVRAVGDACGGPIDSSFKFLQMIKDLHARALLAPFSEEAAVRRVWHNLAAMRDVGIEHLREIYPNQRNAHLRFPGFGGVYVSKEGERSMSQKFNWFSRTASGAKLNLRLEQDQPLTREAVEEAFNLRAYAAYQEGKANWGLIDVVISILENFRRSRQLLLDTLN